MMNHNLYLINKEKYNYLITTLMGGTRPDSFKDYYIMHFTDFDNLKNIFETGAIYANIIPGIKKRLSGDVESNYVYTKLINNSNDLPSFGIGIILNPKLLNNKTFIFNKYWSGYFDDNSVLVKKHDKHRSAKLVELKNVVSNDQTLMGHEIMFKNKINIRKYLMGIHCPDCAEDKLVHLNELLEKYKYKNVKIFTTHNLPYL